MSSDVLLTVRRQAVLHPLILLPSDAQAIAALEDASDGEQLRAVLTRPRRLKHHRLAFALLQIVFDAQDEYATFDGFLDAIKIATGHFEEIRGLDGKLYTRPKSIAFASMDQSQFSMFFNKMMDVILTRILPHTNRTDLEDQVFHMIGLRGPSDVR